MKPVPTFYEGRIRELGRTKLQEIIDKRRMRVAVFWARDVLRAVAAKGPEAAYLAGYNTGVKYLWYHKLRDRDGLDLNHYELRLGNPPSDQDRPWYMRGLDLWVTPDMIDEQTLKALVPGGKLDKMIAENQREFVHQRDSGTPIAAVDPTENATIVH